MQTTIKIYGILIFGGLILLEIIVFAQMFAGVVK